MSFTLTSSGAIIMKAGANVNTTAAASGALIKEYCDQAEGVVCASTRYDWVTNYSTMNTNFKKILDSAVSSWAARLLINYEPSAYLGQEATLMMNVLYTEFTDAIKALNDSQIRTAIGVPI